MNIRISTSFQVLEEGSWLQITKTELKVCQDLYMGAAGNSTGQTGVFSLNSLQQIITTTRIIQEKRVYRGRIRARQATATFMQQK